MNKYIERALKSLNLSWTEDEEPTVDLIKQTISDLEQSKLDAESIIIDMQEHIPKVKNMINDLEVLLHEINVEEYKELNKDKNIKIF